MKLFYPLLVTIITLASNSNTKAACIDKTQSNNKQEIALVATQQLKAAQTPPTSDPLLPMFPLELQSIIKAYYINPLDYVAAIGATTPIEFTNQAIRDFIKQLKQQDARKNRLNPVQGPIILGTSKHETLSFAHAIAQQARATLVPMTTTDLEWGYKDENSPKRIIDHLQHDVRVRTSAQTTNQIIILVERISYFYHNQYYINNFLKAAAHAAKDLKMQIIVIGGACRDDLLNSELINPARFESVITIHAHEMQIPWKSALYSASFEQLENLKTVLIPHLESHGYGSYKATLSGTNDNDYGKKIQLFEQLPQTLQDNLARFFAYNTGQELIENSKLLENNIKQLRAHWRAQRKAKEAKEEAATKKHSCCIQ